MCTQNLEGYNFDEGMFLIERGSGFFIRFDGCMNSDFVFGDVKMFTPTLRCAQWLYSGEVMCAMAEYWDPGKSYVHQ
jgi:hypothetical protein